MPLTPAPPPPVTVPMRRLRATLRSVLRAVEESRERVVLTRHGRPVAALVPFGALAALDLLGRMLPSVEDVAAGLEVPVGGVPSALPAPPDRASTPAPSEGPHGRPV
jgi:prevent-host-death family protein